MFTSKVKHLKGLADSQNAAVKEKELLSLLKQEKAQKGLQDLYFFAKYILKYDKISEQPHRELCDAIDIDWPKKLILEPRGSFKSTVCTIAYSIQQILKNPNIRILIDSEDLANAKKFLAEIKGHFEINEELRYLYGDLVGKTKWTDNEIVVSTRTVSLKEPTILTGGVETPRVGLHFDLIIEDDFHSRNNTQTFEQIQKVIEHWKLNSAILEPEGKEIVIGTRWKIGDLYEEIINSEKDRRKKGLKKKFLVRRRSAIDKEGNLHFPSRLTKDFLEEQRLLLGGAFYACQYLNNPVDEGATLIKKDWIKFYGRYTPENIIRTSVIDPAISEKDEACETCIITIGTDTDGYMYILDCVFMRETPDKIVDMMFRTQELHNPQSFGVETVIFQKALKYWVWERMRNGSPPISVVELKTDTRITKDMRIKGLVPYIESGTILFPGTGPNQLSGHMLKLYDQLTQYPMTKFIDGVDTLAYQLQLYTPPGVKKTYMKPEDGLRIETIHNERFKRMREKKRSSIPTIGKFSTKPNTPSIFIENNRS